MDFTSGQEKRNRPEQKPEIIDNEENFWDAMIDAKNQFAEMQLNAYSQRSDEDILAENRKFPYKDLKRFLKDTYNWEFSDKILNNQEALNMITVYDELIDHARSADSRQTMKQIIIDRDEFLQKYRLGID